MIPKYLDYMDSFSDGMKKRALTSIFPFSYVFNLEHKRLKKYEKKIFPYFDAHSVISEQDRIIFAPEIRNKIKVLSNGVDTEYFTPDDNKVKSFELGFVGNMGYRPNILAAVFISKKLLSPLKKEMPDIRIKIAGARPDKKVIQLAGKNTEITGYLKDIRDAYNDIKIFVSPIFTGIGQQNKILEAMSMKLPVITTTSVNNPIGANENTEILIADNKKEFTEKIKYLLNNPDEAKKIGERAREFVIQKYNWDVQSSKLNDILKNIVANGG